MNFCQAKSYIEKRARRELGFIKSDEIVFYMENGLEKNNKIKSNGDS